MKLTRILIWPSALMLLSLASCTYYCGPNLLVRHFTAAPVTAPEVYETHSAFSHRSDYSPIDPLITFYSARPLPDISTAGKTDIVRILIAKLIQRLDVKEVNAYIMQLRPWSGHGTQSALHPHGDYDFSEISFCSLLYLFDGMPNVLYPNTKIHLVRVLIGNSGARQALRMPGFAGIFRETENHILMGEVSRYLKNQWLHEHGDTTRADDNRRNGLEAWMLKHLDEKFRGGFYEFNSDPYSGYSITAINTLFSFTHSDTVRHAAGKLLNEIMYEYALSSLDQTRYPPFRRQVHRAGLDFYDEDPASSIARVLLNVRNQTKLDIREKQHGLMTLLLHYRLSDALAGDIMLQEHPYFARLGHGRKGSPEIYSGNGAYVLSVGGVDRGRISQLGARPTTLLLHDDVIHLDSCFYICSSGKRPKWNNTGLYRNLACTDGSLHIPPQYTPACTRGPWQVYRPSAAGQCIATYASKGTALMMLLNDTQTQPSAVMDSLIAANQNLDLRKQCMVPGTGLVGYRLHAPRNRWVIYSVNGKKQNRRFDKWPRIEVDR